MTAQGTIRGTITDGTTGETVPFANVLVVETQTGTTSDLDGAYEVRLDAGTYNLEFSFLGYNQCICAITVIYLSSNLGSNNTYIV